MAPVPKETDKQKVERIVESTRSGIARAYDKAIGATANEEEKSALKCQKDDMLEVVSGLEQEFHYVATQPIPEKEKAHDTVCENCGPLRAAYMRKYKLKDMADPQHQRIFTLLTNVLAADACERAGHGMEFSPPPPAPTDMQAPFQEGADARILKAAKEYFAQARTAEPSALTSATAPRPRVSAEKILSA